MYSYTHQEIQSIVLGLKNLYALFNVESTTENQETH